ncbi:transposase [Acidithiobacillus caldus]|jgi:IS5 family transposase|uniref:transposase n=1 Tax=Acidithiobacillus caldus TaxID=33059 RepID=UPI000ADAAC68
MVRVLVVKRLHGLSDEQTEFQLLDRRSFRRFCGLEHSRNIPDRTTIWNFENRIGVDGVRALFGELDRQIRARGPEARAGQIFDATLVPAPKQHFTREEKAILNKDAMPADWKPAKRRQKDLDARWTKKHGTTSHHGYKFTVSVDRKHTNSFALGCPTRRVCTIPSIWKRRLMSGTAAPRSARTKAMSVPNERNAFGGKAIARRSNAKRSRANRFLPARSDETGALPNCQRIAKVRARVEHVFAAITQWGGKRIRTIGQARANFAMVMMVLVYNMRRLALLGA